jgi:hypothetical protein
MSIFGDILNKIVGAAEEIVPQAFASTGSAAQPAAAQPATTATPAETPAASHPAAATPMGEVDVEVILAKMAGQRGGNSNWRTSIVDLLKLLDLDSSLNARKELAQELNVHSGSDGSAEQNIALHKAVMRKLEENGGKVPASLKG